VVVAVAEAEQGIEPGDTIVRIGDVSAASHVDRLRALMPAETARARDAFVRDSFHVISWAAGVWLPTEVELVRSDGSRHTVTVDGVGRGARRKERTMPAGSPPSASATARGEVLVASGDESDVGPVVPHIEVTPVPGRDAALERAIEEIRSRHVRNE
jgi:hypothetical protein